MSIRKPIASYNLRYIFLLLTRYRSRVDSPVPYHLPEAPAPKPKFSFQVNHGLRLLNLDHEVQSEYVTKMGKGVNVQPPVPSRPKPAYPSWVRWILGAILSIVPPFWKRNWDRLQTIEDEIENVAEVVEKVATVTEKLSTEVANKLPDDGKLKKTALLVKCLSEEAVKDAKLTEDFIHKADELEKEVETAIENVIIGRRSF